MAASLDGFIARTDGSVDWLETADTFEAGETMLPEVAAAFLKTIDCYVMGSRTYETALAFEAKGFGWSYGNTSSYQAAPAEDEGQRRVLLRRSGEVVNQRLKPILAASGSSEVVLHPVNASVDRRKGAIRYCLS
jgi:dihydrofolate reductase